jgi:hypothetical protein
MIRRFINRSWLIFIVASLASYGIAHGEDWVRISGRVMLQNQTPLCAMVLANGQYMFSCEPIGEYQLNVPLDDQGMITLFVFVDGLRPFKQILTPSQAANFDVVMSPAAPGSPKLKISTWREAAEIPGWIRIHGTVQDEYGTPLCTMVLANGQHMFSCDENLGTFDLEVPPDEMGEITLFSFCDGMQPFKRILKTNVMEISEDIETPTTWKGNYVYVITTTGIGVQNTLEIEAVNRFLFFWILRLIFIVTILSDEGCSILPSCSNTKKKVIIMPKIIAIYHLSQYIND